MRHNSVATIGFLFIVVSALQGCELIGEGAGLAEGAAAGEAAIGAEAASVEVASAEAASVEAASASEIAAGRVAPELARPPIARALELDGAADGSLEMATRSFGSEPAEGWARHFDRNGKYTGYSEFTRSEVRHFDETGRFHGREVRSQSGSQVFDKDLRSSGRTEINGSRTTAYDAQGNYKGYSQRLGSRIEGFDKANQYSGYSQIYPWPRNYSPLPLATVLASKNAPANHVRVTSVRFYQGDRLGASCDDAQFVSRISARDQSKVFMQVDVSVSGPRPTDLIVPYTFRLVKQTGTTTGSFKQGLRRGWTHGCAFRQLMAPQIGDAEHDYTLYIYADGQTVGIGHLSIGY